jgi:DNA-binding winged helix-turn-helix (wHTH) protein/tetratricopeptide (TPR) repeat protein
MAAGHATPLTLLRFGVFELDLESGELRKAGVRLKLQKQPFLVLKILLLRPGEIVTREELCSEIWPADTFVDFDKSLNTAVTKLRDTLGDTSGSPIFIETIPRRGYRFIAPVSSNGQVAIVPPETPAPSRRFRWGILAASAALLLLVGAGATWYLRRTHPPLQKDTIMIDGFVNRTGDPVFDDTIRQGLAVQLEQSPLLRVVPEEQIGDTLKMMGQTASVEFTQAVAREVCQRTNAAVFLHGSIALIGSQYDLVLQAADCASGEFLASADARAEDKNHVLDAVSKLAAEMRTKLGESLSSVRRYNTPLAAATTPSLAALRSYTQGIQVQNDQFDYKESISWFQKAIELDPNFAMAYWSAGEAYGDLGETNSAKEYMRKAFELRDPVSQREKWLIEGDYYYYVIGDLGKARRSFELLIDLYPDSQYGHGSVADFAEMLGDYNVGLTEYLAALRIPPPSSVFYRDVANTYLALDRIDDALTQVSNAHAVGLDANLSAIRYSIAFYRGDANGMAQEVAAATGKPGIEDLVLQLDADTTAYSGQLHKARALSERATDSAERSAEKEISAQYYAASAVREALFGEADRAKEQANLAKRYATDRDLAYGVALAVALAGDPNGAKTLTEELARNFPEDTIVQCNYLPTLRSALALGESNPQQAITALEPATSCEFGLPDYSYYNWSNLYPVYLRGEAYLAGRDGAKAAAEFQKILSHRGIVLNEPIGALAHLGLGRAYALAGDKAQARAAYQDFLTLWKDADPDIPVFTQAKAEFSNLN